MNEIIPTNHLENSDIDLFEKLSHKWLEETLNVSSVSDIVLNEGYQEIIGMGKSVVPLILRKLQHSPQHWLCALRVITGENPVKKESIGRIKRMAKDWIDWGVEKGYLNESFGMS